MKLADIITTPDELTAFCMLDNDGQSARLAKRIAELTSQGVIIEKM